ncbi:MAG: hypothetical protein IPP07_00550 [Holophagales bacterium]|nr:hypothetical protein [Holophagales bacterium]
MARTRSATTPPEEADFAPSWEPSNLDLFEEPDEVESTVMLPAPRVLVRRPTRRELVRHLREESVAEAIPRLPAPGETWHVVTATKFDHWDLVPHFLRLLGRPASLLCSTWTMSRANARDLVALFDAGLVTSIDLLTGRYFVRREAAVAAYVQEELRARPRCRFLAFENHCKASVISAPPDFIVTESSANLTSNPRLENATVTNDEALAHFWTSIAAHFLERTQRHG